MYTHDMDNQNEINFMIIAYRYLLERDHKDCKRDNQVNHALFNH